MYLTIYTLISMTCLPAYMKFLPTYVYGLFTFQRT
nr:MAG TPA: hypothetical protein [Caudoviricetes sp.]